MIHVIATIEVAPNQREKFLAEFQTVRPKVLAEAGCLEYGAAVDADTDIARQTRLGETIVTIIEKWESVAVLKAHLAAPHVAEYRERVNDFVAASTLHVLAPRE